MKKFIAFLLTFLLTASLFFGCSTQKMATNLALADSHAPQPTAGMENAPMPSPAAAQERGDSAILLPKDRKIILNANLTVEALDFLQVQRAVLAQIETVGGYIQSSSQSGKNDGESVRNATIVARIPIEKYADFLTATEKAGNLTYKQEYTDDVTDIYVDTQARLSALSIEETRLLELMKAAEKVEDIIAIEARLSEVRYEIERYTASKRDMDNKIDYSTVTVNIEEVKTFTETRDGFSARITAALKGSLRGFVALLQNAVITLIYLFPVLLLLAIIAVIVVRFLQYKRKKSLAKTHVSDSTPPPEPK